jgi:S1-C subfamily serine protease
MRMRMTYRFFVLIALAALLILSCRLFSPAATPVPGLQEPPATAPAETARLTAEVVEVTRVVTEVQTEVVEVEGTRVVHEVEVTRVVSEPATVTAVGQADVPEVALDLESMLIDLYEMANPSVVQILVYVAAGRQTPLGSGSGFVYDEAGRIVTNHHVVEGGNLLEVVFSDGSRRRAEIVGQDRDSDLAIIEVESLPPGVQPLPLGDSNALRVGQLAVAIGSPFGRAGSMTLGIVSALGRTLVTPQVVEGVLTPGYALPQVIQTDAPINPGNSGGPLLNLQGEVIGVNSAIATATGIGSGVGFAVPVNAVRLIAPALITEGSYTYPYLGIAYDDLSLADLEAQGMPDRPGVHVIRVVADEAADRAGVRPFSPATGRLGDLIIAIDDQEVRDGNDLISYLVFETSVGQTVQLTIVRDGDMLTIPLTLGARP